LRKTPLFLGIISFVLAVVIFLFGKGARRMYSGIFFVIIGVAIMANARRGAQKRNNSSSFEMYDVKSLPRETLIRRKK